TKQRQSNYCLKSITNNVGTQKMDFGSCSISQKINSERTEHWRIRMQYPMRKKKEERKVRAIRDDRKSTTQMKAIICPERC
uniref:Receptor expression-enhancing protein n=1 Tax=Parascaris univalens TaxID=6257 RepID=A0A915BGV2_PARUN